MLGRTQKPAVHDHFAPRPLDGAALARTVRALVYLDQFHTSDVAFHHLTRVTHREVHDPPDFRDRVEEFLTLEASHLGLRGPLPGEPTRGKRWAWKPDADRTPSRPGFRRPG